MRNVIAIAAAGAAGVLSRHLLQTLIPRPSGFPLGTLVVNVIGAVAAGLLLTVLARRFNAAMWIQEALFVGFLGGFTTFSALSLETFTMIEHRRLALAAAYALGSLTLGVVGIFMGIRIGRALS